MDLLCLLLKDLFKFCNCKLSLKTVLILADQLVWLVGLFGCCNDSAQILVSCISHILGTFTPETSFTETSSPTSSWALENMAIKSMSLISVLKRNSRTHRCTFISCTGRTKIWLELLFTLTSTSIWVLSKPAMTTSNPLPTCWCTSSAVPSHGKGSRLLPRSRSTTTLWRRRWPPRQYPLPWFPQWIWHLPQLHLCTLLQQQTWSFLPLQTLLLPFHLWRLPVWLHLWLGCSESTGWW